METLGFTTVTFRQYSPQEICEIAASCGVHAIEWGGDIHLPPRDPAALKAVLALQQEYGLKAISYGSYYRLGARDEQLWQQITDNAASIGAGIVRIWQGNTPSSQVTREQYAAMISETRHLADLAAEKGLTVAFEFHNGTNNDCGQASAAFLRDVERENVKSYWQPLGSPQDMDNLRAVLPYLVTVHVFHWTATERCPLESGTAQWKEYISLIRQADISPNYVLEFVRDDSSEQFASDVKTLRRLLAAQDPLLM